MNKIPKWLYIYSGIMAVVPILFTVVDLMAPEKIFPNLAGIAGVFAIGGPMGLYISRNLATGLAIGYSLIKRSPEMLFGMLVLHLITDILDFLFLYVFNFSAQTWIFFPVWIILFWVPTILGMRALSKKSV